MRSAGINFTIAQIQVKWKNLKRTFINTLDHNKQTGVSPKQCKYMEEFQSLYGNKPQTEPPITVEVGSSSGIEVIYGGGERKGSEREDEVSEMGEQDMGDVVEVKGGDADDEAGEGSSTACVEQRRGAGVKRKRRQRVSGTTQVLDFFKDHSEKQMEALQRMHEDKMKRMDRFLDLLSKK